jgi:tRNA wybutosine-synthesizing protein 3
MEELAKFMAEGRVDSDIIPVLELINGREDSFSSSSCAGRIALMELPELGDKRNAVFHGKWHGRISPDELREALGKYVERFLYFMVQPPILHVYCRTYREASEMIKIGREAGFKDSAFRSMEPPYMVALVTTEQLNMPVGGGGVVFLDDSNIDFLVERANATFDRARWKLERLEKALREHAVDGEN